jgi:hypothetical protein
VIRGWDVVRAGMSAEPASNWKQSGSSAARLRLAKKPKLRMRMKPRGSRWSRKQRRNSWTGSVRSRCLLAWAESRQRKVTALFQGGQSAVGDGDSVSVAAEKAQRVLRSAEGQGLLSDVRN